jgi:hypothetical protein
MPEELYVNIDNKLPPSEDYNFLRSEGIRLIEKLAGKVWTDYNAHDPGITLLEALCYTLTDLGYRTSFDIKDILASLGEQPDWSQIFLTPKQILTSNPVTITDYRKLIIDTEGVKNAWIEISNDYETFLYLNAEKKTEGTEEPASYHLAYSSETENEPLRIRGLYKVTIEYDEDVIAENRQEFVDAIVRKKLNVHRNLCEDFLSIRPVNYELFKMEADVKVSEGADIERINAKIFQVIHEFFSPSIKFYTLDQMLEKGYRADEIFEGPSLKYGFIDTKELENSERYMDIHLSDIINLISDIPGVIAVIRCVFPIETQSAFSDFTQWITNIKEKEKAPRLDIENSTINFFRSGDRHRTETEKQPDNGRVKDLFNFLQSEVQSAKIKGAENDIEVPKGEFMNMDEYYPFQYSLPASYGMNEKIFNQNTDISVIKKQMNEIELSLKSKQILQLRGYLMVFEQIMADFLSQLSSLKQLFSFNSSVSQTYFPQVLKGIHDMQFLLINDKIYREETFKLVENEEKFLSRRNGILNHLMARFGEDAGAYATSIRNKETLITEIRNKCDILSDYVSISSYRGSGFDFSNPEMVWDTENVTGMKKRICQLLGFKNYNRTFITTDWITIEKLEKPGTIVRYKVVLNDPDKPGNILLESNEYEHESEIRQILQYILQSGYDKALYDIDAKRGKNSYNLKKRNKEEGFDFVAGSNLKEEAMETNFQKTIETIEKLANMENFHLLEHILLRPKLNPQETGDRREAGGIKLEATELLSVTEIPDKDIVLSQKRSQTTYSFKKTTIKDPKNRNKIIWKLSLRKDQTDILVSEDDFLFESHIRKRVEHIRQVATDDASYVREKNAEGRSLFRITDRSKNPPQVLASCKKSYQKEEDMEADIKSLIRFFSFELGYIDDQDSVINSLADPYSFRISLMVPTWPAKFRDPGFRHLFEKAVFLETPAHVYPDVYWLEYKEMKEFETVYKAWLQEISVNEIPDIDIVNNLIQVLNKIRSDRHDE